MPSELILFTSELYVAAPAPTMHLF